MTTYRKYLNTLLLSAFFLFAGCKKEEDTTLGDPDLATPVLKSVYICGYEIHENGNNIAKYWKDGVEVILSSGGTDAIAQAIWVDGNDVHAVGSRKTSTSSSRLPVHWKNNNEMPLSDISSPFAQATDIFIDGSNVYIVGHERNADNIDVAKLWINGEVTDLSNGDSDAKAFAVSVHNGDVHVVGVQDVSEFDATGIAMHWVNGVANEISDGQTEAAAFDINIANNNVYICGVIESDEGYSNRMLWINDNPQYSADGSSDSSAEGLFVDGSTVYMAGKNYSVACVSGYWQNGGFHTLCPSGGYEPDQGAAWKVAVNNDDVYVTGSYVNPGSSGTTGVYWKNGVAHTLGSTPYQEGLYDIFIK